MALFVLLLLLLLQVQVFASDRMIDTLCAVRLSDLTVCVCVCVCKLTSIGASCPDRCPGVCAVSTVPGQTNDTLTSCSSKSLAPLSVRASMRTRALTT